MFVRFRKAIESQSCVSFLISSRDGSLIFDMGDDLVPYNSNLPGAVHETREESIARQFYEWERRGRGWQLFDFPVELEPPFRPFYFFEPAKGPITDHGRAPT